MQSTYLLPPGIHSPEQTTRPRDMFAPVARLAGLAPQYIERLSQIRSLHLAENTPPSELALSAAITCIDQSSLNAADIDLIIMGSVYKDMAEPATSARVSKQFAEHYDLPVGPAFFDVQNACNGVFSAIQIADGLVRTGAYNHVLIVSGETGDAATRAATEAITAFAETGDDPHGLGPDISNHVRHYAACYTLGSIGAATVVSAQPTDHSLELMGIKMAADSNSAELCILASQEHPLVVDPPMLLEVAAPFAIASFKAFMRERNNSIESLEHLFVHQPSKSTIADYSAGLGYPIEKIVETVTRFGNVITCSTLLGWDCVSQGLRSGDLVGANIVGSGISSGSLLLRCV